MEFIDLNKFSELHDGEKIFFCKTEFIQNEFKIINSIKNDVVLITGNSDYPITSSMMINLPKNVIKWYAQNALHYHPILEPLPLGLENKNKCLRDGHGPNYYDRTEEKEDFFRNLPDIKPTKKIYSNFNIFTNFNYRNNIKNICINSEHVFWDEPQLTIKQFMEKILEFESVICPIGNGIDTHRLWEVLYLKRIPITFKVGDFKIYELYEKLPIVVLDREIDLLNEDLLFEKINTVKNKEYQMDLLNFNFWEKKIINEIIK